MGKVEFSSPVIDSVPKVNNEIAVGEDLDFQRRWWAFERLVWAFFGAILLLTLMGAFGRGWLAKDQKRSPDGALTLKYDRIQRTGTPSDFTFQFGPDAVRNGQIRVFMSQSVISKLGAQRISPEPAQSILGDGGVIYTFPVNGHPAGVVISMQPSGPGSFPFRVGLPDAGSSIQSKVIVVP
jgi:hypothetical protein